MAKPKEITKKAWYELHARYQKQAEELAEGHTARNSAYFFGDSRCCGLLPYTHYYKDAATWRTHQIYHFVRVACDCQEAKEQMASCLAVTYEDGVTKYWHCRHKVHNCPFK
jgi:hypothetical protein